MPQETQHLPLYPEVLTLLQNAGVEDPEEHAVSFCRLAHLKQPVLLTVTSHTTCTLMHQQNAETFRYQMDEFEPEVTLVLTAHDCTLEQVDPDDHERIAELLDNLPIPWTVEEDSELFLHANMNRIPQGPPATQQQLQALVRDLADVKADTDEERFAQEQSIFQKHFQRWETQH